MTTVTALPENLLDEVASLLQAELAGKPAGHCSRVNDVAEPDALSLAARLRERLRSAVDVRVLGAEGTTGATADQAIELRNRKRRPLLLLVPTGAGQAASSLDNSFHPLSALNLLAVAADHFEGGLGPEELAEAVKELKRALGRHRPFEGWARLLATVTASPTLGTLGQHLWLVGLVPDLQPTGFVFRLRDNARCVGALARPSRPASPISERLASAGVQEGPVRTRLSAFLEQEAGSLALASTWTHRILQHGAGELTFENWPLAEARATALQEIKVKPFLRPDGSIEKSSKLKAGPDGQPICETAPERPGAVSLSWVTQPSKTDVVASWRLDVLPPADLRDPDQPAIASSKVAGNKRNGTVRLDVEEDDLADGTLFVIRLTALDEHGGELLLESGERAEAESDHFEVLLVDFVAEGNPRRSTAGCLAGAVLKAAMDGSDDLSEDQPQWDLTGQVLEVRIGGRRLSQVRVSTLLVELQALLAEDPVAVHAFSASPDSTGAIVADKAECIDLRLGGAVLTRRKTLFTHLKNGRLRPAVEGLSWSQEDAEIARSYLQTYRRALDNAEDPERRQALLKMDTLTLVVPTSTGLVRAVALLPTHPLRLAWTCAHSGLLRSWANEVIDRGAGRAQRRELIDLGLVDRVTPANLPFTVLDAGGDPYVYKEELTYGAAVYLDAAQPEPEAAADAVCRALGIGRTGTAQRSSGRLIADRFSSYLAAHPGIAAMRVLALNPGAGDLLEGMLAPTLVPADDEEELSGEPLPRAEIIAYSDHQPFTTPMRRLRALQERVLSAPTAVRPSHLTPRLGLASRPSMHLLEDDEGHHLAVLQDLARGVLTAVDANGGRTTSFHDLLTPTMTNRLGDAEGVVWQTVPALLSRSSGAGGALVEAHRVHQAGVASELGRGAQVGLDVGLAPDELAAIRSTHDRADWVLTLDRNLGLDLYEDPVASGLGAENYVLDYAPDFVEGLSHRLTVTTAHREEVLRVLGGAMRDLGLAAVGNTVSQVLDDLGIVSGRLALRLLGDTSFAREAVSLAAVIAHLERRGHLGGVVVVPVDAHPELFGPAGRVGDGGGQRCDLLLARITSRTFKLECVEVKSRKEAALPAALADRIVEQLNATRELLMTRFFATDPPRIDHDLQRSRLAGLLHYYADRAALNGLVPSDKLQDLHRNIDRIERETEAPEISLKGYVVSLEGAEGFPERHNGVNISVLTADDLGHVGFTTLEEYTARSSAADGAVSEVGPSPSSGEASPTTRDRDEPESIPEKTAQDGVVPSGDSTPGSSKGLNGQPAAVSAGGDVSPSSSADESTDVADELPQGPIAVALGQDHAGDQVNWAVSTKGSPHTFIVGIPGQGKSVTTRRIIREFAAQRLPALVFDFHGDMAADPPSQARVLDATQGLPFSPFELPGDGAHDSRQVNQSSWELAEIVAYVCGLGEIQRNHVYKGLQLTYRNRGFGTDGSAGPLPTMDDFADAVEAIEEGARGKNARDRLRPLTDFGLFAPDAQGGFAPAEGGGLVVDVSGLGLEAVQLAAGAFLLRKVYRDMFRWGQGSAMRLAVVLDEAHRLAKDVTLPKLMKEGRKYGISVVVASQGAADFHRDVVGNAGTKIVFRTNYPDSKSVAGYLRGRGDQDLSQQIEQLSVGQAYVATPEHPRARRVYMYE